MKVVPHDILSTTSRVTRHSTELMERRERGASKVVPHDILSEEFPIARHSQTNSINMRGSARTRHPSFLFYVFCFTFLFSSAFSRRFFRVRVLFYDCHIGG